DHDIRDSSGICDEQRVVCYGDRIKLCRDHLRKHALELAGCPRLEWLQLQFESVGSEYHRLEDRRIHRIVRIQEDGDATSGRQGFLKQLKPLRIELRA